MNTSTEQFQWTDELVKEYGDWFKQKSDVFSSNPLFLVEEFIRVKSKVKKEEPKQWWQKLGIKFDGTWYSHPSTNSYDNLDEVITDLSESLKSPRTHFTTGTNTQNQTPKPEEPLPIKVSHFTTHDNLKGNNWDSFFYQFCSTKPIPTEKYEPIKKAIEKILSGEDWVMDFAKTMVKEMYANELLEAQKKAFLASRGIREYDTSPKNYIYPTVDDYIKSLNKQ